MTTSPNGRDPVLSVADFGPIEEAKVEIRPLTVFVGPSNTGKSYLAVLIYALHRFFSDHRAVGYRGRRPLPSLLHRRFRSPGKTTDVPEETLDAVSRWVEETAERMRASRPAEAASTTLPESIAGLIRPILGDVEDMGRSLDEEITRYFGIEGSKDLIRRPGNSNARIRLSLGVSKASERRPPFEYDLTVTRTGPRFVSFFSLETPLRIAPVARPFFTELQYMARRPPEFEDDDERTFFTTRLLGALASMVFLGTVGPVSRPVHYLPADRTGVMHAHRVVVSSLIGRASRAGLRRDAPLPMLSGVLADFLEQLIELGGVPERRRRSHDDLACLLESNILGGAIRVERSVADYPSFFYRPDGWKGDLPLMNASSMVSELAPVVLYLRHVVRRGDVLIIEEPESHLHPAMQVAFVRLLAAAVRSGIRVVITTHSEWVLEALANLVRLSEVPKGKREGIDGAHLALTPREVGAWLFKPKRRPRGSVVEEIPLDVEGGTFPAGYGEITESIYNDWAMISNRIADARSP